MRQIGDMISIEVAVIEETSGFLDAQRYHFYMFVKKFAMSGLHPLQVKEIQRLTDDAVAISFSIPKELKRTFHSRQGNTLPYLTTLR